MQRSRHTCIRDNYCRLPTFAGFQARRAANNTQIPLFVLCLHYSNSASASLYLHRLPLINLSITINFARPVLPGPNGIMSAEDADQNFLTDLTQFLKDRVLIAGKYNNLEFKLCGFLTQDQSFRPAS